MRSCLFMMLSKEDKEDVKCFGENVWEMSKDVETVM